MVYNGFMSISSQLETNSSRTHSGLFKSGVSGNPSGRPKSDVSIRELAKTHTETALSTLAEIMVNPKATPTARVNAACALLDRGWGKPSQHIEAVGVSVSYTDFLNQLASEEINTI